MEKVKLIVLFTPFTKSALFAGVQSVALGGVGSVTFTKKHWLLVLFSLPKLSLNATQPDAKPISSVSFGAPEQICDVEPVVVQFLSGTNAIIWEQFMRGESPLLQMSLAHSGVMLSFFTNPIKF